MRRLGGQQVRRCAAVVIVCLVTILLSAPPATAHATLIGADPADGVVLPRSPRQATLTFDEAVTLPRDGVQVFDAAGAPEKSSAASRDHQVTITLPADLKQGSHLIVWRVISGDGHPVTGSLTFAVGRPSAYIAAAGRARMTNDVAPVARATVQAIIYLGLMLAVGLALFATVVMPAAARMVRPRRRLALLSRGAAMVAVVAGVIDLPLTVAGQQGLSAGSLLMPATWAQAPAATITSLILLTAGLGIACVAAERASTARNRGPLTVGVCLTALAPALTGHSRAVDPQILTVGTDALHVLAGSVWLGGLVGLALILPSASRQPRLSAVVLTRFSTIAAATLAVLVTAGSLLAWQIVGSWGALTGTTYGRLLLVKIALVVAAASVAAWNRFVLLPRTKGGRGDRQRQIATTSVGRLALVEATVIIAVVTVTGILVDRSPHDPIRALGGASSNVVASRLSQGVDVIAILEPGRTGHNTVRIMLHDPAGEPVTPSRPPTVRLISPGLDLGGLRIRAIGAGSYLANVIVPTGGHWELQVGVQLNRFENPVATMDLDVIEARPE